MTEGKNNLKPTLGRDLRRGREEGVVLPFPSGNAYRIAPVSLDVLLKSGRIPDLLTPFAVSVIMEGIDSKLDELEKRMQPDAILDEATEWLAFVDLICEASFLEPRIVDDPQADDEIAIVDLPFVDRGHAMLLALQPIEVLRRFRDEEAASLESVPDGEDDSDEAERAAED